MKSYNSVFVLAEAKCRSCTCSLFIVMSLICGAYFVGSAWLGGDSFTLSPGLVVLNITDQYTHPLNCEFEALKDTQVNDTQIEKCNDKCSPVGSEPLPKGIVSATSDFEMHPLSGPVTENKNAKHTTSLLALAVGIKQKTLVNQIVNKFLERGEFVVMLFHYDSIVDEWREFEWSDRVIHVSASNQTKWWFAKRFLHPDIVTEYEYIFLWDEDLGVENFNPQRYLYIIKEEGLEISQPALDGAKSEVHHHITVRSRRSKLHRRYYRPGSCDANSTAPPCAGWVEMMAPVFSREAWRCAWYMIQNDLIHAWGLDMQLGYCAQGDRTVKVGVVDEQYVVHMGLPTLGGASSDKNNKTKTNANTNTNTNTNTRSKDRSAVRVRSYDEMRSFRNRWNKAVKEDKCWIDPFKQKSTEMDQQKQQSVN